MLKPPRLESSGSTRKPLEPLNRGFSSGRKTKTPKPTLQKKVASNQDLCEPMILVTSGRKEYDSLEEFQNLEVVVRQDNQSISSVKQDTAREREQYTINDEIEALKQQRDAQEQLIKNLRV